MVDWALKTTYLPPLLMATVNQVDLHLLQDPITPSTVGTGMGHLTPTLPGNCWQRDSMPCWLSSRQLITNLPV